MPYFTERTYVVNEYCGFSNRPKKKDTSFRSFLTFLIGVFLLWVVIYFIIRAIDNRKGNVNLHSSEVQKESYHGSIRTTTAQTSTPDPRSSVRDKDIPKYFDHSKTTIKPSTDMSKKVTKNQYYTLFSNEEHNTATESLRTIKNIQNITENPNSKLYNEETTAEILTTKHYENNSDFQSNINVTELEASSDNTFQGSTPRSDKEPTRLNITSPETPTMYSTVQQNHSTSLENEDTKNYEEKTPVRTTRVGISITSISNRGATSEMLYKEEVSTESTIINSTHTGGYNETYMITDKDNQHSTGPKVSTESSNIGSNHTVDYNKTDMSTKNDNQQATTPKVSTESSNIGSNHTVNYNKTDMSTKNDNQQATTPKVSTESSNIGSNHTVNYNKTDMNTKNDNQQATTPKASTESSNIGSNHTVDYNKTDMNTKNDNQRATTPKVSTESSNIGSNNTVNYNKTDMNTKNDNQRATTPKASTESSNIGSNHTVNYNKTDMNIVNDNQKTTTTQTFTTSEETEKTLNLIQNTWKRTEPNVITTTPVTTKNTSPERESNDKPKEETVCRTARCKRKVSQILQLMDHSIDHCEDFYQFSCGSSKYVKDDSSYIDILLKAVYTLEGTDDEHFKAFRQFFDSCVEYDNKYGYTQKINQVLTSTIRDNNITSLLAFLMNRQSTPLFEVNYGYINKAGVYGMQMLPPDSRFGTEELKDWSLQNQIQKHCLNIEPEFKYQTELDLPKVYKEYIECKKETFNKMAETFFLEVLKEKRKEKKEKFLDFFSEVESEKYSEIHISDLNGIYPQIDWQDFFNKISGTDFEESTPIHMYMQKTYFETNLDKLKDRILTHKEEVIEFLRIYYQLELYQNLRGAKQNREEFCMNQAVQLMPEIAAEIFYENSGLSDFQTSLLQTALEEILHDFDWLIESMTGLEEASKKQFLVNLNNLKPTIKLFNNDQEWKKYLEASYNISYENAYLDDDYVSNVFSLIENKRRERYTIHSQKGNFIQKKILEKQFSSFPEVIPLRNIIVIPNVFLFKLNKNPEDPPSIMQTYLKYHLSRILALHFIEKIQEFDSKFYRSFVNSLNSNLEQLEEMKVLDGHVVRYEDVGSDYHDLRMIARLSEETRMADNIALDLTFRSIFLSPKAGYANLTWIKDDYCPEKLFYIMITQEYCQNPTVPGLAQQLNESPNIPSTFRTESMIMNSQYFGDVFECRQGTRMNIEEKVVVEEFEALYDYREDDVINEGSR